MVRNTLRTCKFCGKKAHLESELELFVKGKGRHGRINTCKSCWNKKQVESWKNPKDPKKASQLLKRYECTPEEYQERMATSDCCEVCGTTEDLVYDHCHDSMKFRGVLCRQCNSAIGGLGDTLEGLMRAVNYLTKELEV